MTSLTICQPYAHLIAAGLKLVENRTWPTRYRGPLIIHAGKSRQWLEPGDEDKYPDMVFGAAVAVCRIYDSVEYLGDAWHRWTRDHDPRHIDYGFGPWCWMLEDVYPLAQPYPYRGAQGLFDMPVRVVRIDRTGIDVSDLSGLWDEDDAFHLEPTQAQTQTQAKP